MPCEQGPARPGGDIAFEYTRESKSKPKGGPGALFPVKSEAGRHWHNSGSRAEGAEQLTAKQREIAIEEFLIGCKLPTGRSSWRRNLLYHDVLAALRRANLSLFVLYRTSTLNTVLKSDSADHITNTNVTIWAPTLQLLSTHRGRGFSTLNTF